MKEKAQYDLLFDLFCHINDEIEDGRIKGKFRYLCKIAVRFPDYSAEILYREACVQCRFDPLVPWGELSARSRLAFQMLQVFAPIVARYVEIEDVPKKPAKPRKGSIKRSMERVSDDDDDMDPRARNKLTNRQRASK
ncbi:MAG: hypothetical protein OER56_08325 [Hyphomicrobiales bacterium]|nr:hypothetical protein [Hyphomicrobiales bacterium]